MIKPEMVPKEVVWKLQDKLYYGGVSVDECTQAIAAALNAWPGAFPHTFRGPLEGYGYVLPLPPQDTRGDE